MSKATLSLKFPQAPKPGKFSVSGTVILPAPIDPTTPNGADRAVLRGEKLQPVDEIFEAIASRPHGHVEAVRVAMQRLGFESLVASRRSRERDLVCAMVAARIIAPQTKLATTRWWHTTTLAEEFDVTDADEDDLYAAMDWLLTRQGAIEKKLAARHLGEGSLVLYDLSSSYFEGTTCPLAKRGHSRDGKKGTLQVNYGLLTDRRGCPVAVSVYDGNTNDPTTLMPHVHKLQKDFGTISPIASKATSFSVCSPTTSSGICARRGAPCSSPTRISSPRPRVIRWPPPHAPRQPKPRPPLISSTTAPPRTASAPCRRNSLPSSATPAALPKRAGAPTFTITTTPTPKQRRALELLTAIRL